MKEISVTVIATGFDMDSSGSMKANYEKDSRQKEIERQVEEVLKNGHGLPHQTTPQPANTPSFFRDEPVIAPAASVDTRKRSVFDDTSAINAAEIRTAAAGRQDR